MAVTGDWRNSQLTSLLTVNGHDVLPSDPAAVYPVADPTEAQPWLGQHSPPLTLASCPTSTAPSMTLACYVSFGVVWGQGWAGRPSAAHLALAETKVSGEASKQQLQLHCHSFPCNLPPPQTLHMAWHHTEYIWLRVASEQWWGGKDCLPFLVVDFPEKASEPSWETKS